MEYGRELDGANVYVCVKKEASVQPTLIEKLGISTPGEKAKAKKLDSLSSDRGVGGTVASESAMRSVGTLLSRVRALPLAP
ncbi:hypothetical protein PoB_007548000 [Plakobranchus ocellatus]|uniref:Uncharacterized protein n=1 Tax=Plakobranchus ocellatus TaxID=259542 RepID=A0AAV4DY42_9GAST|nr:hypothetical protein PoB_007548000 [Plakobranchus ocellatus]